MAIIYEAGNPDNIYYECDPLPLDEFLPIVRFKDPSKYVVEGEELTISEEEVTLSEHLNIDQRNFKILQLTTDKDKIKLPFTIKKGSDDTWDGDGYIEPSLSIEDENFKITGEVKILKEYNTEIEVEIALKGSKTTEFYLDFYANDDEEDFNKGECENVHCGRVKIIKKEPCICQEDDWVYLPKMVSESEKVLYSETTQIPWMNPGDTRECYHYALHQLKVLGYWVKSERWNKKWDGTKELNDNIYQLFVNADVAGMKKGSQKEMFKKTLAYLKQAMRSKTPVMVGLDYHVGYANDDLTTDHFAVITGCGRDSDGKLYFDVTDNFYPHQKYYCDCRNYKIISEDKNYIISQVRESKKL